MCQINIISYELQFHHMTDIVFIFSDLSRRMRLQLHSASNRIRRKHAFLVARMFVARDARLVFHKVPMCDMRAS